MIAERTSEEYIAEAWADKNKFSLGEAAALWVGESPPLEWAAWTKSDEYPKNKPGTPFTQNFTDVNTYNRMLERLTDAIHADELVHYYIDAYEYDDDGNKFTFSEEADPHFSIVRRENLIKWAETQASYPTFLFGNSARACHWNKILTLCLDENHQYHSRELAVAIKSWEHFYIKENINKIQDKNGRTGGHAEQFKKHINDNYRYSEDGWYELIKENMVNHIATIANKDPRKHRKPEKLLKQWKKN